MEVWLCWVMKPIYKVMPRFYNYVLYGRLFTTFTVLILMQIGEGLSVYDMILWVIYSYNG